MKLLRVFPRRTRATPSDEGVRVGSPGLFDEADAIHISVAFTWDLPRAEKLAEEWRRVARVEVGGPALGKPGGDFVPGRYLKPGYVITSRGCPNRCWFCKVPEREGGSVRELPIVDGWNVLDDNLLACSERHIRTVFAMLSRQERRVEFTGGLEAARLKAWHVDLLCSLRPRPAVWFAYDTPGDLDPLRAAGAMLLEAGFTRESHRVRCYVLCGWARDTFERAEQRMLQAWAAGFLPMAMPYHRAPGWRDFARKYTRPAIAASLLGAA